MSRSAVILLPFLFIIVEGFVFKSDIICEYTPCLSSDELDKPAAQCDDNCTTNPPASEHNKQFLNPAYNGKANNIHIENPKEIVDYKDNVLNVRNRRSSPALAKLLKSLFVKTKTISEDKNEVSVTHSLPRERSNDIDENDKLIHLMYKLNVTLQKLNDKLLNLSQYENEHSFLVIKVPVDYNHVAHYRVSRDLTDKTENVKLDDAIATEIAAGNNDSQAIAIDSALKDVQNQISTIKRLKDDVTSEKTLKVGYLVANLETLELNLKKFISRMNSIAELNTALVKKILVKVQLSNLAVSNLMDYLRMYENKF